MKDLKLEDLDLPGLTYNSLKRNGIHTIQDLVQLTQHDLLNIGRISKDGVLKIKAALGRHNLELALSKEDMTKVYPPGIYKALVEVVNVFAVTLDTDKPLSKEELERLIVAGYLCDKDNCPRHSSGCEVRSIRELKRHKQ